MIIKDYVLYTILIETPANGNYTAPCRNVKNLAFILFFTSVGSQLAKTVTSAKFIFPLLNSEVGQFKKHVINKNNCSVVRFRFIAFPLTEKISVN